VYDALLPTQPHEADQSLGCWLIVQVGSVFRLRQGAIEIMAFPLVQEQSLATPSEILAAVVNTPGYRVVIADSCWKMFTAFSFSILVWCIGLLTYSGFTRIPEISLFPELDLVSKLSFTLEGYSDWKRFSQVAAGLFERKSRDMTKLLYGVRLGVEEDHSCLDIGEEGEGNPEVIELQDRGGEGEISRCVRN
jgi:hypothetical protein